jgi:Flp pilus assembly protein TadG
MRARRDCGQAFVITILFLGVLLAFSAAVVDVGSWYRAQRDLQKTVDSAALAGAQGLPDEGEATDLAVEYGDLNGGGLESIDVSTKTSPNDTIKVVGQRPAPGFFAKIFGLDEITVRAQAVARTSTLGSAKYVAPIVVPETHPKLSCDPNPCAGETTLNYLHLKTDKGKGNDEDDDDGPDGSGSFGFINLSGEGGVGTSEIGDWILNGYDAFMPLGNYNTSTGNPFSSTHVKDSLDAREGDVLLFPVYRKLTGTGDNAKYEIVGWAGFVVTGVDFNGNNEKIFGHFTEVFWTGIEGGGGGNPQFGARMVSLVE